MTTTILEHTTISETEQVPLQTFKRSFEKICAGVNPWLPLGNFMHQFFGEYQHLQQELVREPIELPAETLSQDILRWAVFCAASVEYLCHKYDLSCPEWAMNPRYVLNEPWYYAPKGDNPVVQEDLRKTTPKEFTNRNIFCGDRTYRNKYEFHGRKTA